MTSCLAERPCRAMVTPDYAAFVPPAQGTLAILGEPASSSTTSACAVRSGSVAHQLSGPERSGEERCAVAYVIAQPCIGVKDNSCVEVCPVDCIHSTDDADQYFINPDECIDCGVCAEVCPVEAIFFEDDLPEQWAAFKEKNATFFQQ